MEFSIKAGNPEKMKCDCVAIAVFASGKASAPGLSVAAQGLDRAAGGRVARILRHGDFDPKPGATLMLYDLPGVAAKRVLLVGFGKHA